ncbi:serine/threonine-protein phosphatase PGAM5, mitochondrial-like [Mixophyes fleayi]|uniref:serine/threonine-protein phosphatase PGAM5, mitochondrial-like n=1 Tax=Mixophyes fleayi TaxID=3061075 RepID=UPI003F4DEF30
MFLRRVIVAGGAAAASALLTAAVVGKVGDDSNTSIGSWPPVFTARWDHNWDCREPVSLINMAKVAGESDELELQLRKYKAKATRHIFLIRHGQYNKRGKSDRTKVLTDTGKHQTELTGQRLADLGYPYDKIIYSTLTRARETMEMISKSLPDVPKFGSDLLREGSPIQPDPASDWKPSVVYYTDGTRIEAAFRNCIHRADPEQKEDSYEIIVCHDNVIRYIVCRALQLPPQAWDRLSLHHGSISYLVVHPNGNVSLKMLGENGFMPPGKLSNA